MPSKRAPKASPLILVQGPPLAGCREFVGQLGWLDACAWQIPQLEPNRATWGRIGPALVRWRERTLLVELGYRGALWIPPLTSEEWATLQGSHWIRFRAVALDSLARAAAVLFVADSQPERSLANIERLERLGEELRHVGRPPDAVPVVFALNKRDLAEVRPLLSRGELEAQLRWPNCQYVETSARTGQGIDAAVARLLAMIDATHQPPITAKP